MIEDLIRYGIWFLLWAAVLYITYRLIKPRDQSLKCPRCGGELNSDPYCYRYVIVHTCEQCGDKFESLKSK